MKTMKRFLAMMVALILAVSCMSVSAFAADSISASATVNAASAKPGDTIEVTVSVSSASFAGYSMKLGYDSSALKLVSVTKNAANNPGLFSGNANTVVVSNEFVNPGDRILIVDDFLATGAALIGLKALVEQAGATVVGAGIAVEKVFQGGGNLLREQGMRVESLAMIASMDDNSLTFC